jgi:hypothetical protein
VICGIDSSILRRESELSGHAAEIVALSREFGNSHPRRQLNVRNEQLFRALDRFLSGAVPVRETSLPWQDAYEEDPHRWKELFRLDMEHRYSRELGESIRVTKTNLNRDLTEIYAGYTADGLGFDDIQRVEARGFGHRIVADGHRAIENRLTLGTSNSDESFVGLLPTTFDLIVNRAQQQADLEYPASQCNRSDIRLGDPYGTKIRTLGEREID